MSINKEVGARLRKAYFKNLELDNRKKKIIILVNFERLDAYLNLNCI